MRPPEPSKQTALFSLAALVISALHFATFFNAEQSILTDIRYFLYFAQRVAAGDVPHLDLFDNKTFLASFVGALFYRVGEILGLDPLQVIRAGYLALSTFGGLLCFWIFRRLGGGSSLAGFLGLFAALSFSFTGSFAAIGNAPKILMNLCGLGMCLAVARRNWFLAGILGALAFMDWQVGALVSIAAGVCALVSRPTPAQAVIRVGLGSAIGLAPFGLYYALHGALGLALHQTLMLSLLRGSTQLAGTTLEIRLQRIGGVIDRVAPGQEWLIGMALIGIPVGVYWLWQERRTEVGRLLFPVLLYTLGIAAFSLLDFQRNGDFFALISVVVLWLGILWVAVFSWIRERFAATFSARPDVRWIAGTAALLAAILIAQPLWLRTDIRINNRHVNRKVTLSEQREVANLVNQKIGSKSFALLASSELLFLMPRRNAFPYIYFNEPAYQAYGEPEREDIDGAASRLIANTDPDIFVFPGRRMLNPELAERYVRSQLNSTKGNYVVILYERK